MSEKTKAYESESEGKTMRKSVVLFSLILVVLLSVGSLAAMPKPGQPVLVTSAGQSADDMILKVMLDRQLEQPVERIPLAQPTDLAGVRTIVLMVGVSNKGLGSAGIDLEQEKARIQSLLDQAEANGIFVILAHIGGPSRRGVGSDEVAKLVAPFSHEIVVIADSNEDQFFNELVKALSANLTVVEARNDVATVIAAIVE